MNKELTFEEKWKQAEENWKKPMTMDEYFYPYRLPQVVWLHPMWLLDVSIKDWENVPCIYKDPHTRMDYLIQEFYARRQRHEVPCQVVKKVSRLYKAFKVVDEFLFGRMKHDQVFAPRVSTVVSGL